MSTTTPWFKASAKPVRNGRYQAQSTGMRCNCCWIDLEWRDGEWFSDLYDSNRFNVHFFQSQLRRWRGLTTKDGK